jgi:hypothetical protein
MPGQALRIPGADAPRFQDNRHMKVVRLSALRTGRLYTQENIKLNSMALVRERTIPTERPPPVGEVSAKKIFLVLISARGWVSPKATLRPEGSYQWSIPITASRIETATFRLVAQCLNQMQHRVPQSFLTEINISKWKWKCNHSLYVT